MGVLSKDKEYFIKKFAFVFNLRSNLNSGGFKRKKQRNILFNRIILRCWCRV